MIPILKLNECRVLAALHTRRDDDTYSIMFFRPETESFGTAMWRVGQEHWYGGSYDIRTFEEAMLECIERAGVEI